MSENTKEINELKRKAKELSDQASEYEFGFETPSKKSSIDGAKQVFAVYGTNNPLRRTSVFIETSNSSTEKTIAAKEKESQPNVINVPVALKQTPAVQKVTSNVFDNISDSRITQTNEAVVQNNDDSVVEFPLNPENDDDDLLLRNSLVDNGGITEPLLFRNNYFKIISQQGNSVSAMCMNCGVDENNQPKAIYKSQKNISSNFLDNLKVKIKVSISIFISLFPLLMPNSFNF